MERFIYMDDELEDFLKEKSDQYKLYPSDRVWNNIHKSIQPKRRWSFVTLTVLMLLISSRLVESNDVNLFNGRDYLLNRQHLAVNAPALHSDNKMLVPPGIKTTPVLPVSFNSIKHEPVPLPAENTSLLPDGGELVDANPHIEIKLDEIPQEDMVENIPEDVTVNEHGLKITKPNIRELGLIVKNIKNTTKLVAVDDKEVEQEEEVRKILWGGIPLRDSRLKWHVSFSPTISYRRLTSGLENITEIFRGPLIPEKDIATVNNSVIQKPAVGAEAGAGFTYRLTNNLQVRGGVQLNYSRYQLRAMFGKPEQTTLAIGPYKDSLNVYTNIRNEDGKAASWLNNEYFQVAMPLGVEWAILGNATFKWNVAASVQPVYNFANNIYLLSTDFRHYAKDPSLVRRWNVNAGVETFVSYKMGSFNWQAGPQFRYQLVSSYKKQYPINEYMVDFGFKVGVTKTIF